MKLKLEFSMKEAVYKNKIKAMQESHGQQIAKISEEHE